MRMMIKTIVIDRFIIYIISINVNIYFTISEILSILIEIINVNISKRSDVVEYYNIQLS